MEAVQETMEHLDLLNQELLVRVIGQQVNLVQVDLHGSELTV
jgi:hypothetical protein